MPSYKKKSYGRKTHPSATHKSTAPKGREFRFKGINNNESRVKPEPFPRVLQTRTKFGENAELTTSTQDVSAGFTYRIASIWDPNFSGTGKTVCGHAQLAAIYGRYLVTGTKVRVDFNNPVLDGMRVGVRLRINTGQTAIVRNMTQLVEQPMTYMSGLNDSGSQKKHFEFFIRPWTLMGLSKLEYMANTSKYSSLISANPAEDNAFIDVFMIDPTNVANTVRYVIKMIHYVQLYDRKYLASSSF